MSDIKRRKLGDNRGPRTNNNNNRNNPQGNRPAGNASSNTPGNTQGGRQGGGQNRQAQQGQGQPNQNNPNRRPNQRGHQQGHPQGNQQRNQQRSPQRQPQRTAPRPPPPPPAYFQRDLLLVAALEATSGIEQVRAKFDPLSKKLPAHITLIFPEPAKKIEAEFLKKLAKDELPPLNSMTFSNVIVHDEMYLWLLPDDEGRQKLLTWHGALLGVLTEESPEHTQDAFVPHITLGYVPRRLTPEEAIAATKELITLPVTIDFNKVMLEEFSENQVSTAVDTLNL